MTSGSMTKALELSGIEIEIVMGALGTGELVLSSDLGIYWKGVKEPGFNLCHGLSIGNPWPEGQGLIPVRVYSIYNISNLIL
jgi:hypothetical protein